APTRRASVLASSARAVVPRSFPAAATRSRSISARWINRTSWYPPMSSGSSGGKPGCRRFRSSVAMLVTARPPGGVRADRGPALAGSDSGGCGGPVEKLVELQHIAVRGPDAAHVAASMCHNQRALTDRGLLPVQPGYQLIHAFDDEGSVGVTRVFHGGVQQHVAWLCRLAVIDQMDAQAGRVFQTTGPGGRR